jgi:hypothetical protein
MSKQTSTDAADAIRKMLANIRTTTFGDDNNVNNYSVAVIVAVKHSISELNRLDILEHKLEIFSDENEQLFIQYGDFVGSLSSELDYTHIFYHATVQLGVPEEVYLSKAFSEILMREAKIRLVKEK